MNLKQHLESLNACIPAVKWVGDRTPEQAWAECPRGDWLLWALESHGVDCSVAGYWCAERARQSALRALPPSPERDALAACAPITDRDTAMAARRAARAAGAGAAGEAARAAAGEAAAWAAAAWAGEAAWEVAAWAGEAAWEAAERRAIADYVRAHYAMPEINP